MVKPVVLITGALKGIGRATAVAFAKEGARVVISGRRDDEGRALQAELRESGAKPNTSTLMCGMRMTCVLSSMRLSRVSDDWTLRSTTPETKGNPVP
jgi:NAD(P)-dependent dehydrogenase (short-subunit alcohol dehydrogenase family)